MSLRSGVIVTGIQARAVDIDPASSIGRFGCAPLSCLVRELYVSACYHWRLVTESGTIEHVSMNCKRLGVRMSPPTRI